MRQAAGLNLKLERTTGDGGPDAAIRVEPGAEIRTDARGAVSLVSDSSIFLEGGIAAPAGSIALRVTPPFGTDPGFLASQGIWLGTSATLDARGQALLVNEPSGLVSGDVLDGGMVSLHADRGFVNLLPGSIIDVSGTAASVDVANRGVAGGVLPLRQQVPSNGGAIELQAAEGMQLQGTLKAAPGPVAGAAGGSLSIELSKLTRSEPEPLATGQQPFPAGAQRDPGERAAGDGPPRRPESGHGAARLRIRHGGAFAVPGGRGRFRQSVPRHA